MFDIATPRSREEIAAGLKKLEGEITSLMVELGSEELFAPQGEHWSPERHLRHLVKSVGAVAAGMRLPRVLLRFRFGRPRRPSRSFDEVVEIYRQALAAGGRATGRYEPSPLPEGADRDEWRDGVLERWQRVSAALSSAVERWSDRALDRYQAPHPLLGPMTVREILFFTLYHNAHHARRIHERRSGRASAPELRSDSSRG